jgi:hypothetical protein
MSSQNVVLNVHSPNHFQRRSGRWYVMALFGAQRFPPGIVGIYLLLDDN